MLKIVVADDEAFVLQSICTSINWKEIGLKLVGSCKDGMEAWHAILDENPDLVMTDIRMPGLSGLELIEKTKEISPQTVFIILSGYQEFEYARTAMQYGVRHYLIKPCSCEKMEEVLREAIQEQKHQRQLEAALDKNRILGSKMCVLAMKEGLLEMIGREDRGMKKDQSENWITISGHLGEEVQILYVYYLEEVWIRHFVRKLPQNVIQKAGQLMLYVKNTLIFLNSGKERLTKSDISAIEEIVCDGQSVTTLCETHLFPNFQEAARELVPKIRRYSSLYLVELDGTCIQLKHYAGVFAEPKELLTRCIEHPQEGLEELRENIRKLENTDLVKAFAFRMLTYMQEKYEQESPDGFPAFWEKLARMQDEEEIGVFLTDCISNLYLKQASRTVYRNFILKTKSYAREHMSDGNLSLKWIAENYLYMNTDYVSREFSTYLNRIRMEEAKQLLLLLGDEERIYQVAEQVGCSNARYFGQAFKKYTGQTPTAYIRQYKN